MSQEGSTVSVVSGSADVAGTSGRGALIVIIAGVFTTALAMFGVWWLDTNTTDFHVMGWYGDYVIPAGALLIGIAAGSGYGIASYLTGFRIRRGLLLAVLCLQLAGYAVAQYLEFKSVTRDVPLVDLDGEALTFPRYYHLRAMNFAWNDHGKPGKPLGGWGYFFLGLGVIGFIGGGVLAPAGLMKVPYCERCSLYMKSRALALIPASTKVRKVSKKDATAQAEYVAEQQRATATASALLERVTTLAAKGDALTLKTALADYPSKGPEARRADKLPARLRVSLVRCRQCSNGHLQPTRITGQGRGIRMEALERLALAPDVTRIIGGG